MQQQDENTSADKDAQSKPDDSNKENCSENCVVDSVGEVDDDQDQIQLTMAEAETMEVNNVDNEDSLNLTIGEDEAIIFQDSEVIISSSAGE